MCVHVFAVLYYHTSVYESWYNSISLFYNVYPGIFSKIGEIYKFLKLKRIFSIILWYDSTEIIFHPRFSLTSVAQFLEYK